MYKTTILLTAFTLTACAPTKLPYNTAYPALYQESAELCFLTKHESGKAFTDCQENHVQGLNFPTQETAPTHYALLKMYKARMANIYDRVQNNTMDVKTALHLMTSFKEQANKLVIQDAYEREIAIQNRRDRLTAAGMALQDTANSMNNTANSYSTSNTNCYSVGNNVNCTTSSY